RRLAGPRRAHRGPARRAVPPATHAPRRAPRRRRRGRRRALLWRREPRGRDAARAPRRRVAVRARPGHLGRHTSYTSHFIRAATIGSRLDDPTGIRHTGQSIPQGTARLPGPVPRGPPERPLSGRRRWALRATRPKPHRCPEKHRCPREPPRPPTGVAGGRADGGASGGGSGAAARGSVAALVLLARAARARRVARRAGVADHLTGRRRLGPG